MQRFVVILGLLLTYLFPAAAYEVIFHQGFEGDQFPPAGWSESNIMHYEGGYQSDWSLLFYRTMEKSHEWYFLSSPKVPISDASLYTFRYYSREETGPLRESYARVVFDVGDPVNLDPHFGGSDWGKVEATKHPPLSATEAYFSFFFEPWDDRYWFPVNWWIDNVSVVETATAIAPASLGRVKAAYR